MQKMLFPNAQQSDKLQESHVLLQEVTQQLRELRAVSDFLFSHWEKIVGAAEAFFTSFVP